MPGARCRVLGAGCCVLGAVCFVLVLTLAHAQSALRDVEWRYYGGDAGSQKYSPLAHISKANVQQLAVAWRWASPDNAIVKANPTARPGGYEDTPLMVDGVLYTATSLGTVAAIDPATGTTIWTYEPETWKVGRPPNLGYTHRGVAYWTDGKIERIISGTHDAYLISLDAKTGKPDLAFGDSGRVDAMRDQPHAVRMRNYAINSTPVVVRNVIIHGANIPDGPVNKENPRGDVRGYDMRTGKLLWTFHAIPQKGEFGYDTWENGSAEYTGGTNIWSLISVDEELGYVYLPFGTPSNDFYGGHRLGDNLFAESLVCLDATTGKRVWHFQGVHHGLWDYDFPAAPILVDIIVNGRPIKAVAQVSKQAFLYVFDRRSGEPVWPIEERAVPASTVPGERAARTQPFPTKPPPFDRQGISEDDLIDFTPELRAEALAIIKRYRTGPLFTPPSVVTDARKGTIQVPGSVGGADWTGAAVDPETGMLYVPSMTNPFIANLVPGDPADTNLRYRASNRDLIQGPRGLPLLKPPYGRITAIDLNRGEQKWMVPNGDGPRDHPAIKHLNLPPLGQAVRAAPLVTKTLLFVTEGDQINVRTPPGGGGKKVRAFLLG